MMIYCHYWRIDYIQDVEPKLRIIQQCRCGHQSITQMHHTGATQMMNVIHAAVVNGLITGLSVFLTMMDRRWEMCAQSISG